MRTSQINPQIAINALMGYLGTYNYYYSWYNFIHNTYDNNFTGYVPIPGKENPFIALEAYLSTLTIDHIWPSGNRHIIYRYSIAT